jgi:hypothetical protein
MNHRTVTLVILGNLAILAVLSFVYPHLMIAPGTLIDGHRSLNTDCFACHAAFRGASPAKCIACHRVENIGRLTTLGVPIRDSKVHVPFHQKLVAHDCMLCHSDHKGLQPYRPAGRFSHQLLDPVTRERCESCHAKPRDSLHSRVAGNCRQCHAADHWKPATFDHDQYFSLDGDHNADCATCHPRSDFSRYTCYGCHEHSVDRIRSEHEEEGISDFTDCADCHSSGSGEGGRRGGRGD